MQKVILKEECLNTPLEDGELPLVGVHTRNGDSIELHFHLLESEKSALSFGFSGGFESAIVTLDFTRKRLSFATSDWTRPQPIKVAVLKIAKQNSHVLLIEKTKGPGKLIKNANINVFVDRDKILAESNLNLLPEIGASISAKHLFIERFVHRGIPSGIPEYLHVGGWQMLNKNSIDDNLQSLFRGLEKAAAEGVQLLVTPETSLTGLFPHGRTTKNPAAIAEAEAKLQSFVKNLDNAPYLVAGLPAWEKMRGHRRKKTRYNVSRVYDPDGHIVSSHAKIHSCEHEFWHGYQLQEFDVYGIPVCMHICHDARYPEVWTLPVMFGARLILHPANARCEGSIDTFEAKAKTSTMTSHAFYIHVNGGGGSYIVGPQKNENPIAVSSECRRDSPSFPMIGEPQECFLHAKIRIADAFGYWPVRSFRASEEAATAYMALYKSLGGQRWK